MLQTTSFKRRPAALALAALTFFWTARAAQAQVEAVAAALSEARATLAAAQPKLKEKAQRPAPSVPEDVWQKILEAVKTKGKYILEAAPIPSFFNLEEIRGDVKADHIADSVSVAGFLEEDGRFQPEFASLLSEEWKIDPKDGNWHVEQWSFRTDLYGEVAAVIHSTLVETPDMTLLSVKSRNLVVGDPGAAAKFKALLARWSAGGQK